MAARRGCNDSIEMAHHKDRKDDSLVTMAGRDPAAQHGIVNPPVYHASTVIFPTVADLDRAEADPFSGFYYARHGNPTSFALEDAVNALEGGHKTFALPSGLAAVTTALLAFLEAGDHLLMVDTAYGPTRKFCTSFLRRIDVETTFYDPCCGAGIADLMRDNTKVVYVESPGSQTFEVQDLPAIAAAAHSAGAIVITDNTWSGGVYCKPLALGADVSLQAATKYLVGHSDAMLGTVTTIEACAKPVRMSKRYLGMSVAPDDCYLGLRGLRTLSVRLARHQETGLKLAHWLTDRPEVDRVLHPALPDHPGHDIWRRDFTGASGLFAMVLNPCPRAALAAMLDDLEMYGMGYSWGGFESLILPNEPENNRTATSWDGSRPCVRIHAGLEDPDELIADLERGFDRLRAAA